MSEPVEQQTLSLLFADTHGFSKLSPFQLKRYVEEILPITAKVLDDHKPIACNTWGDGLFVAFSDPSEAANCALELRDKFLDGQWENKGLPNDLSVRIALHIGSVGVGYDPVRKEKALFGREVNRTARIEPIVAPTQIYATQAFRGMLIDEHHFAFDSLGMRDLAKSWGTQELFALRRSRESEVTATQSSPPSSELRSVMTLANEALARYPDKIGPLLNFIDTQNFHSRVAWYNWHVKLKYDISKVNEGIITEKIEFEYNLCNHSGAPVSYPLKLFEFGDMASDLNRRSFTFVHNEGEREQVLDTPARSRTKVITRHDREVVIPPGDTESCRLIYAQAWKVNPHSPVIHNCFVPRDPVLGCKIEVQLPDGYSIGMLVNAQEQTAEVDGWDLVYRIPLLSACQAIEYMILAPPTPNSEANTGSGIC